MQYGCCELGKGGKQMSTQQSKINYKAGIYLRLSKDDENSGESASISNQRNIVTEYANPIILLFLRNILTMDTQAQILIDPGLIV